MIKKVPIADIFSDDEFNCRGHFTAQSVAGLAENIASHGLLQPIVVQPWTDKPYRVVCGHRRLLAARMLKWQEIECVVREGLTEDAALLMNFAENVHRRDLNIMQEAVVVDRFVRKGWDDVRIGKELNVSPRWVRVRVDLLGLPKEIQDRAAAGFLTQHQIQEIATLGTRDMQMAACREAVDWKIKGEKGSFKIKKDAKAALKKGDVRGKTEIFEMQERIQDLVGEFGDWGARCLAWVAGVIPTEDLEEDLRKRCASLGRPYRAA